MSRRLWLAYAAYSWLRPCLPAGWPVPPLDLVWLGACWARGRAELSSASLPALAFTDAVLGAPSPWVRWLAWLCLAWLPRPAAPWSLPLTALGCGLLAASWDLLLGTEAGVLHAVLVGVVAALLAYRLAPESPSRLRRSSGWGAQRT